MGAILDGVTKKIDNYKTQIRTLESINSKANEMLKMEDNYTFSKPELAIIASLVATRCIETNREFIAYINELEKELSECSELIEYEVK